MAEADYERPVRLVIAFTKGVQVTVIVCMLSAVRGVRLSTGSRCDILAAGKIAAVRAAPALLGAQQ